MRLSLHIDIRPETVRGPVRVRSERNVVIDDIRSVVVVAFYSFTSRGLTIITVQGRVANDDDEPRRSRDLESQLWFS